MGEFEAFVSGLERLAAGIGVTGAILLVLVVAFGYIAARTVPPTLRHYRDQLDAKEEAEESRDNREKERDKSLILITENLKGMTRREIERDSREDKRDTVLESVASQLGVIAEQSKMTTQTLGKMYAEVMAQSVSVQAVEASMHRQSEAVAQVQTTISGIDVNVADALRNLTDLERIAEEIRLLKASVEKRFEDDDVWKATLTDSITRLELTINQMLPEAA